MCLWSAYTPFFSLFDPRIMQIGQNRLDSDALSNRRHRNKRGHGLYHRWEALQWDYCRSGYMHNVVVCDGRHASEPVLREESVLNVRRTEEHVEAPSAPLQRGKLRWSGPWRHCKPIRFLAAT